MINRFLIFKLFIFLGLSVLSHQVAKAQEEIPGGANTNPGTSDTPEEPSGDGPDTEDDGGGPKDPPEPEDTEAEGDKSCEEDEDGPQDEPGSVNLHFSLDACPLEYSVASGGMKMYLSEPVDNMGDTALLQYNSLANAKIREQITEDLPAGVDVRFAVNQVSGKALYFDHKPGSLVLYPSGNAAFSSSRAQLYTEAGEITADLSLAVKLRQYRSAGGYMEFSIESGKITKWSGPTGRGFDFSEDAAEQDRFKGLDIVTIENKLRQIKTPAGMLDIVSDTDGRGYRVITYLPSEVGDKAGAYYGTVADAKPKRTVHVRHEIGTLDLVAIYTDHGPDASRDRVTVVTYSYVETFDGGHEWQLKKEAEGVSITNLRHVIPDNDVPGLRKVVREAVDGSGAVLLRKEILQQYQELWSGWTTIQQIIIPGNDKSLQRIQRYRYGVDPAANDFRKMNWMMMDTGSVYEFSYDAEGRMTERRSPWLDGEDGMLVIEKYDYQPHVNGETVLPGDGRPRTTTVEVGTVGGTNAVISKSFFAAYDDAANNGCHTVINEDAATPSSIFGATENRRKMEVYYERDDTVSSGRIKQRTDENKLVTRYLYSENEHGGFTELRTSPLTTAGLAKEGLTEQVSSYKDGFNRVLSTQRAIYDGSVYIAYQLDTNSYTSQGQMLQTMRTDLLSGRERVTSSYEWAGDQMLSMTAVDGTVTTYDYDGFDRLVSSSVSGVAEQVSPIDPSITYAARPSITTLTSGTTIANLDNVGWGNTTSVTSAGDLALTETVIRDARGRTLQQTEADGYSTSYTHEGNGIKTTIIRPDGGTQITAYYLDGKMKSVTGTGIVPTYYSYTALPEGGMKTTVYQGSENSPRYSSTAIDLLGRVTVSEVPSYGGVVNHTHSYISGTSRKLKTASSAPQTPATLYEYDAFATVTRQAGTVRSTAQSIDVSSIDDRVQEVQNTMLNDASGLWRVSKQYLYPHEGAQASDAYLVSESRSKIAGFTGDEIQSSESLDNTGNWQKFVVEESPASRLRTQRTTSSAFNGEVVSIYHGGKVMEQRQPQNTASTIYQYDDLGRAVSVKQPRHVSASTMTYVDNGNLLISRADASGATAYYTYYPQGTLGTGRIASITAPDTTVSRSAYDIRGNVVQQWGSASAPMEYSFNDYNQLTGLSTYRVPVTTDSESWPSGLDTADVTTWVYHESTGLLTQKLYADGQGPAYTYDLASRLKLHTSARGIIKDYSYTDWGQLDVTAYSDDTPSVDMDYDRVGRQKKMSSDIAIYDYTYSESTLLKSTETISYDLDSDGTPELTRQLDYQHDSQRRSKGYELKDGNLIEHQAIYGYDEFSRLETVDNAVVSFTYNYLPNANLLHQVVGPKHTVTNTWEVNRDILDVKSNTVNSSVVSAFDYTVNTMGRRTNVAQSGSTFSAAPTISWLYDSYGQLILADSSVSGHDRSYLYDAMGNRQKSADSLTLPATDNYVSNQLNQYSSIAGTPAVRAHDADGNLITGTVPTSQNATFGWDGENGLINTVVDGLETTYFYDAMGRRIAKTNASGETTLYTYEGWNCIAEYTGTTFSKSYTWGMDLSGSMQGAGGVGGLLCVTDHSTANNFKFYPAYDGNGNVSEYINQNGAVRAHYEYDAFGNTVVSTGVKAGDFTYKFSTKPEDEETGLYYYGYRYYDPITGKWPSRDPIEEKGGLNLYGFVGNDGVNYWDVLGLQYAEGSPAPPNHTWDNDFNFGSHRGQGTFSDLRSWHWWGAKLNGAEALGHLPDGTRAYRHYRGASGDDLSVNYSKAYNEDSVIKEEVDYEVEYAQEEAEYIMGSRYEDIEITGSHFFTDNPATENWQKAIGRHLLWGAGTVAAEKVSKEECASCCKLTLSLTITMEDRYNFNRGESDIGTGISDNVNGRFEQLGWARSFMSRGSIVKEVTWCKEDAPGGGNVSRGGRGEGRGRDRDRNRKGGRR